MSRGGIDTVTLELLRQGPSAGQLLSSATQYLALCGNGPAETVLLPLDQRDFQRRMGALRYGVEARGMDTDAARAGALEDMARDMTRIFDQVRALPGAIERASADMIHLRLVLSATELAALPFELANVPRGLPGEGLPLCLVHGAKPVIVTRETRRIHPAPRPWPVHPRILFAHVSQPEVPADLVHAHLLALVQALVPWTGWAEDGDTATEIARHLTVLPAASLRAISEHCTERAYTHVHILAHGINDTEPHTGERRFALALHRDGSATGVVPVRGELLASALRAGPHAPPTVVTLAACDAGGLGSLLVENGSVAHALHESGVQLVVASQLPLSMRGSVVMVDTLYQELLIGNDPRLAVHATRQRLFREERAHHDWASLVVYATMPVNPGHEFERVKLARLKVAIDAGMAWLNRHGQPDGRELTEFRKWFEALEALEHVCHADVALDLQGFLASAVVRWCDPDWPDPRRVEKNNSEPAFDPGWRRAWRAPSHRAELADRRYAPLVESDERSAMERAIELYERVFTAAPARLWAGVNALALRWYLGRLRGPGVPLDRDAWQGLWWLTQQLSGPGSAEVSPATVLAARIELSLLVKLAPTNGPWGQVQLDPWPDMAALLRTVGPRSYDAFALRRQLLRYERWWCREDVGVPAWREPLRDPKASAPTASPGAGIDGARVLARELRLWLDERGVPEGWDAR